jgi:hypothetical protein
MPSPTQLAVSRALVAKHRVREPCHCEQPLFKQKQKCREWSASREDEKSSNEASRQKWKRYEQSLSLSGKPAEPVSVHRKHGVGREAEEIVISGGLLPDEMMRCGS